MSPERQNQIAWIVGLVFLASAAAGVAVDGRQADSAPVRAVPARVYTDTEQDTIWEFNDRSPEFEDRYHDPAGESGI